MYARSALRKHFLAAPQTSVLGSRAQGRRVAGQRATQLDPDPVLGPTSAALLPTRLDFLGARTLTARATSLAAATGCRSAGAAASTTATARSRLRRSSVFHWLHNTTHAMSSTPGRLGLLHAAASIKVTTPTAIKKRLRPNRA